MFLPMATLPRSAFGGKIALIMSMGFHFTRMPLQALINNRWTIPVQPYLHATLGCSITILMRIGMANATFSGMIRSRGRSPKIPRITLLITTEPNDTLRYTAAIGSFNG